MTAASFTKQAARSFLPSSSCRHEGRTVSSSSIALLQSANWSGAAEEPRVQSLRILPKSVPTCWSVACQWHSCHTQVAPTARTPTVSDALPSHRPHDGGERTEVRILDDERMFLEERHDGRLKIPKCLDRVGRHTAPRAFRAHAPAAEGRNHRLKYLSMILVLVDVEHRLELPTPCRCIIELRCTETEKQPSPSTKPTIQLGSSTRQRNGSFLLIVRTGWIFTIHACTL
jgi:hypothetical protein